LGGQALAQLGQQPAGLRHRQQEIGHGLAGQGAAVRQHESQGRAFDGELRLALQRAASGQVSSSRPRLKALRKNSPP
jgi:hypothetical protein